MWGRDRRGFGRLQAATRGASNMQQRPLNLIPVVIGDIHIRSGGEISKLSCATYVAPQLAGTGSAMADSVSCREGNREARVESRKLERCQVDLLIRQVGDGL